MRLNIVKPILTVLLVLVAIIVSEVFSGATFAALLREAETAFNTTNLIRLHILANSDASDDQAVKTVIRDTVLREVKALIPAAATKFEVWQILSESISRIEDAARSEISNQGKCYDVTVELGTFSFPQCSYGDIQVPAGDYDAIRVVLGRGTGQNWWCVLFPPLCFIEITDDGKIQGLDTDVSPGEVLLRLELNSKTRINRPWVYNSATAIPVLEIFAFPSHLSLSLNDLL